ncbi:lanC 3 [Brachionus plicatilis]|uniref:LanC 3 n=1 Tax=Brachionus plicatilis TaxID=10195 RepID=A0A3M7T865_BRAPC|nr:lanC 3 [Brachionus plicatilis]
MLNRNADRFFPNPYSDYKPVQNVTVNDLVNQKYCKEYMEEKASECILHLKPNSSSKYCSGKVYTGNLGLVFMCYKLLSNDQFENNSNQLKHYVKSCIAANEEYVEINPYSGSKDIAFFSGKGGLYIMGFIASKILGEENHAQRYAQHYANLARICETIDFLPNGSDELFVGRAGYLCGLLLLLNLNKILPKFEINRICNSVIRSGCMYSNKINSSSPLMYAYHNTEYLGAAHGLSGILQILLSYPEYLSEHPEADLYVKRSVDFILSLQKQNGNFPTAMDEISHIKPRHDSQERIHWCHGAGGVIFLMAKAFLHYKDQKYLNSCIKCGELIWNFGLLKKGPGICHGVAGNGYAFLILYRLTKDPKYLYRANKFAEFLSTKQFNDEARVPDSPFSLFEGLAGTVCFLSDLLNPQNAEFPLIPIF